MSEFPANWLLCNLEEIVSDVSYGYTAKADKDAGDIRMLRITDIQDNGVDWASVPFCQIEEEHKPKYLLKDGDLVFARTGATVGKSFLIENLPFDSVYASYLIRVRFLKGLSVRYMSYFFRSSVYWDQITGFSSGIGQPNVNGSKLKSLVVPLAPSNEQARIEHKLSALLSAIDACRERLDKIPLLLKRFRQSALLAATTGKLTEDWRGSKLPWASVQLGEVADDFSYGTSSKSSKTGKVPVLRMGNIQDGKLDWSDLAFSSDRAEIAKYQLSPGDVLFNRTNSPELVGKTAIFRGEQEAIYAGYLIRIKCSERLLPDYLNYSLNAPAGRDYCWRVKSDGVSQSNINATKLAAFEFLLPSLREQHEIVRRVEALFSSADRLEARFAAARRAVIRLTTALLAKAFRGALVPQDPNDEPARVLLERIQAAHASAPERKQSPRSKSPRSVRIPKENSRMSKSRLDEDVKGKPYLAHHLRLKGGTAQVESLFEASELPLPDFYKQLAWEVAQGHVLDRKAELEAGREA